MALLENGQPIADPWTFVADGADLPAAGDVIVTLARLNAGVEPPAGGRLGVRLTSSELAEAAAPHLPRLALVAVEFPKFRDGRGFSTARELRERFGFKGEVRAVGHTLPDQYRFLLRVGFSTVEVPDGANLASWQAALTEIAVAYQRAVDDATPASLLRRRFAAPPAGERTP